MGNAVSESAVDSPLNGDKLQTASYMLIGFQVVLFFLFGFCATIGLPDPQNGSPGTVTQGYNMFIGVEIMMFIGFGYLMTFLRKYGVGAVAFTMIITAMGLQWALFTESFFKQWYHTKEGDAWIDVDINIYSLLQALYAISSVLISFGACIGKITPAALIVMTIIELACHSFHYVVLGDAVVGLADIGGTYYDHMFGAAFGLSVSYVLGMPRDDAHDGGQISDVLSLIGTLFLWIYWPSFVGGAAMADSAGQHRALVHTILALSSSTVCAFASSMLLSNNNKFRPVDIQNATLAGGVAIGVIANLTLQPIDAILTGGAAGIVSTFGYNVLQPWLEEKKIVHDTCGVNNLHFLPAIVGAIASVIIAGWKSDNRDVDIYGTDAEHHWWMQLVGILMTVSFAVVSGLTTGGILKLFGLVDDEAKQFKDSTWWDMNASLHGLGGSTHGVTTAVDKL